MNNPPHDDLKDALAAVVDVAKAPMLRMTNPLTFLGSNLPFSKFGGAG